MSADEPSRPETSDTANQATSTIEESVPEFAEQAPNATGPTNNGDLKRFGDVHVTLAAHLGQTQISIEEVLALKQGSVIELDREISQPVELFAQGVPLANGEVVVIDDRFAIRIKEIY